MMERGWKLINKLLGAGPLWNKTAEELDAAIKLAKSLNDDHAAEHIELMADLRRKVQNA